MSTAVELGPNDSNRKLPVRIFLSGDVMIGRGIDQILPYPCDPRLYEPLVTSATEYLRLAEQMNGPITKPANLEYVWGAALEEIRRRKPDAYIINLETSITYSDTYLPKGINYRVSPENAECLRAAEVDCCALANNHILDWGRAGLLETMATLEDMNIKFSGAGCNLAQARTPAVLEVAGNRRVIVFAFASATSGTPRNWMATESVPGVNLLADLSDGSAEELTAQVNQVKRPDDIVIVSVHWGPNWGYDIPEQQRRFARKLIDDSGISVLFGHSSHHAKAIEVYQQRLILYGCGDFLNDYEGITGYEEYRDDLAPLYAATFDPMSADLLDLEIIPFQIQRFQLNQTSDKDSVWLRETLDRESRRFGVRIRLNPDGGLTALWA
ncbi:MAG TPA: CapA family protein [Chthoniobacterales bacterium]|nr:CapA family protein [Chthoniobacterales bacterium]